MNYHVEGPFVRIGVTNWDKRVGPFVPGEASNQDKRPMSTPLARLAFGPETKVIYCPGPKGNRDKWPETKVYSVVVDPVGYTTLHSAARGRNLNPENAAAQMQFK